MIHYLNSDYNYTPREYLNQWLLNDTLVITDNDFVKPELMHRLMEQHPIKNQLIDITHNPYSDDNVRIDVTPILTNNFKYWYHPDSDHVFFPLFLWMYSNCTPLWYNHRVFDAGSNKTNTIMCLNNMERDHRTWLWNEFNRKSIIDKMMYTFRGHRTLPGELPETDKNDSGIAHPVYSEYAVNIVTETSVNLMYVCEKTCKPFIAKQIPIIVGSIEVNKFLQDIGLDMFGDIVPWHKWDNEPDLYIRLQKIADFVEQWIRSGTILNDYQRVLPRVERNKQYFHSEIFRNRIMNQMLNFEPA